MTDPTAYLTEQRRRMKEWTEDPKPERNPELEEELAEDWEDDEQEREAGE